MKKNITSLWGKVVVATKPGLFLLFALLSLQASTPDHFTREHFAINTLLSNKSGIWEDANNWSLNRVPVPDDDVIINHPDALLISDVTVRSLTINSGKKLTIKPPDVSPADGGSLTVNTLVNDGTLLIEGSGALVVNETTSGAGVVSFERKNLTANWRLLALPLHNVSLQTLINANQFAVGTGGNLGIAFYDNNQVNGSDSWIYQTATSTGTLSNGKAFASKLHVDKVHLKVTGNLPDYQVNDIQPITNGASSGYNLIGNPYTSYIPANSLASAENNVLTVNTGVLSEQTIWFWQDATQSYFAFNHASLGNAFYIAAMQGFFVKIKPELESADFVVHPSMQKADNIDNLVKHISVRPEINLSITSQDKVMCKTNVYYIEGTTKGFDNGYDSTVFEPGDMSFMLYTHLAEDNAKHYAIQSLPNQDYETMIIPVGIHASTNSTVKIDAEILNFPKDITVYLQDVVTNTFVNLSERKEPYVIQITDALEGKGRFYIHTT